MEYNEKNNIKKDSNETNVNHPKNIQFGERLILVFNKHKSKIITIGNVALFFISIFIGSNTSKNIPPLLQVRTIVIISLVIFICLSPVLIMSTIKCLRRFIVDEDIENKNLKLSDELGGLRDNLQELSVKFNESIYQNENYFEKVISPHIDDCSKIDNLVRRSQMIKNVSDYYQHLTKARENVNEKDVYLTSFSTKPYKVDNENRNIYYSTDIEFIKRIECNVYRIVTVHTSEKLSFLKKLAEDAKQSESENYYLAYLDIEEFSDEAGDKLPVIVGMDIIENEVIIMDFRYARALRKNDRFEKPLYMESEKIADKCREYYKMIWNDISGDTPGLYPIKFTQLSDFP